MKINSPSNHAWIGLNLSIILLKFRIICNFFCIQSEYLLYLHLHSISSLRYYKPFYFINHILLILISNLSFLSFFRYFIYNLKFTALLQYFFSFYNKTLVIIRAMKAKVGKWTKKIDIQADEQTKVCTSSKPPFELAFQQISDFYIGSLVFWGTCRSQFHTNGEVEELKQVSTYGSQYIRLVTIRNQEEIEAFVPFSPFHAYITRKTNLGRLRYFCQVQKPKSAQENEEEAKNYEKKQQQLYKQLHHSKKKKDQKVIKQKLRENEQKLLKSKKRGKKTIPIRMQIFISHDILNQRSPQYSNNLKKLDAMQTLMNTLRASTEQHRNLKLDIDRLIEDELFYQKVARSLLLYFMEKSNVKVLNRSFIKPPPKLNYLMRQYRRLTIGLITKNSRAERRIKNKIENWKIRFTYYTLVYPCIGPFNVHALQNNYYTSLPKQIVYWESNESGFGLVLHQQQSFKMQVKYGMTQKNQAVNKILNSNLKRILDEIGAYGFGVDDDDSSESDEEGNQASKKSMDIDEYKLMKRNQKLMEKFQSENKYFRVHQTPSSMISQLKPYQGQALQWMKYREGKITVQQLFVQSYQNEVNDFQFERKLSPFWEEVETISGAKFYVNYLTGQFTKQFHDWKSIRGGILADQMGLGKTVMTLSLLADENWEGVNLIVVPVAVLLQWKQEIRKHCGQSILVYQFHSDAKNRRKKNLNDYHIILITYATLGHEYRAYSTRPAAEGQKYLFQYNFQRVVLDEAHNIRGTNTLQFNAVLNLRSKYSWCLTGTLIQNSEQDLFAIFKFLRVEVFSEEPWWNQYIKNAGCTQAKMNVIQTVLRPIVLRRTKASTSNEGEAIIKLTKKNQLVIRPQFSKNELNIYQKLELGVRKFFKSNIEAGKNYTHVFQIISKLRQFCCHPALIFGSDVQEVEEKDIQNILNKFLQGKVAGKSFKQSAVSAMLKGDETCVICLTQPDEQNAVLTQCGHYFCQPCLKRTISINPNCPVCRNPLSSMSYIKKSDFVITEDIKGLTQSSKMTAILKTIEEIYERGQKCVIFTQWIKIIRILQEKLLLREIQFETILGGMTPQKRQKAIKRFKQKSSIRFLIVSIRAGATGLNLAFANNVMICDPWWNPSHEEQAIGRVHRIGQTQDVNVYRFIMKNSIEQKIQKMHVSKRKLANQVMMQKGSLSEPKASAAEQLIRLLEG